MAIKLCVDVSVWLISEALVFSDTGHFSLHQMRRTQVQGATQESPSFANFVCVFRTASMLGCVF